MIDEIAAARENGSKVKRAKHAFDIAAAHFAVLSEPMRLQIMHATSEEEKAVSEIVEELGATQSNISRHLNVMYRDGLLTRRKEGIQVFYVAADPEMVENLRNVCTRLSIQMDEKTPITPLLVKAVVRLGFMRWRKRDRARPQPSDEFVRHAAVTTAAALRRAHNARPGAAARSSRAAHRLTHPLLPGCERDRPA